MRVPAIVCSGISLLVLTSSTAGPESAPGRPGPKIGPRLAASWDAIGDPVLAWVFFEDKGAVARAAPSPALVSERSLRRRSKVRPGGALVDATDVPVDARYVETVRARVVAVRQRSRWFNAVSVRATREQLCVVAALPHVRRIELVARFRRNGTEGLVEPAAAPAGGAGAAPEKGAGARPTSIDYGLSGPQLSMIQVPALHERGLSGRGVLVGHFDNGHRLLAHEALAPAAVAATWDFVDGDPDPAPPAGAPEGWGAHGIATLSVLAGYKPGKLIGPAYGASFALARTEDDASETPIEEDNWLAAAEWADSLGADVISSSLGYLDGFDPPYPSYTWRDMDGNTTIITRAADMAVARGIVVVNAVGNQGVNPTQNTLVAPADGDSVIAVGGVNADGSRYASGSVGPTRSSPPRIKPDVQAQASAVYLAGTGNPQHYGYNAGTSFACPLVAGVVALLLEARPDATPMQIADALRATASRASTPDNLHGWGVVRAVEALGRLETRRRPATMSEVKSLYR